MSNEKKQQPAATNSLFTKDNYMWMLIGLAVMAVGFILMSGGKSADPKVFNKNHANGGCHPLVYSQAYQYQGHY